MRAAVTTASTDIAYWLMAIAAAVAVGLLIASSLRPSVKLPIDDWHCTATHPEQKPLSTINGPTMVTVYVCDQWSRR